MGTHGLNSPPLGADVVFTDATGAAGGSPTTGIKSMIVPFHFGWFSHETLFGNGRSRDLRLSHLRKKIFTSRSASINLYSVFPPLPYRPLR